MDNVVSAREFWDRKVNAAIDRFCYTGDLDRLVSDMTVLGYPEEEVVRLAMEDE